MAVQIVTEGGLTEQMHVTELILHDAILKDEGVNIDSCEGALYA
ncbi:hypothetical protein AKJ16_DCAP17410 [Drosera capensis]